jgi:hypothetical protein
MNESAKYSLEIEIPGVMIGGLKELNRRTSPSSANVNFLSMESERRFWEVKFQYPQTVSRKKGSSFL